MPYIIELNDAQSAIRYLRLTEPHWQRVWINHGPKNWVFRGQGNADWPLLPKLHREENRGRYLEKQKDAKLFREENSLPNEDNHPKIEDIALSEEFYSVEKFVEHADAYGLIKGREFDLSEYRSAVIQKYSGKLEDSPKLCGGALEALMLAQHHGQATRLLDWSASPLISLYFAAESVVENEDASTHFAIWGLQTEHAMKSRLPVIPALRSQNNNALSQKGHFTIDLEADQNFECNGW